jgi:hypothetical protein
MTTKNKTPGLRIVGGTACGPVSAESYARALDASPKPPREQAPPATKTARNFRLREQRKESWRAADAATRYWRARIEFEHAVSIAQDRDIPEGRLHPDVSLKDLRLVDQWRAALVKQLLTPAPDLMSITWKKAALAQGQYRYVGVSDQRIERAIAEDLAFLAAHPTRHNNSEAAARRREFKEAMRRRIRDVAASRDLSDDEIKPALTLKHEEIANFSEQHGVSIEWLLEGKGRIFNRGGRCELVDIPEIDFNLKDGGDGGAA